MGDAGEGGDDDVVEVFEGHAGGLGEGGHGGEGDAGLDALQIEVEGGEEGLVGSDLAGVAMGTLCHREGGKMALSNFLRLIEVLSRAQDGDAAKRMHGEQILVASEDYVCVSCCGES